MEETRARLEPKAPFEVAQSLGFLRGFEADGVAKTVGERTLELPLGLGGRAVLVLLKSDGTTERPALEARLRSEQALTDLERAAILDDLRSFLSLGEDLEPFYALARRDDAFWPLAAKLYGYHPVRFPSVFACVCWALVTQRTPNPFAYRSMRAICDLLGPTLEVGGTRHHAFPAPAAFLAPDAPAKLLAATNNTRKVERLLPLARAFLDADEGFLRRAPYDEAYRWLLDLPGLGPWSAEYVMLRGLGRYERSPWTDTWLLEGISQVYAGGLTLSRGDARALAEGYSWHQGLWVHYLKVALWH